MRELTLTTAKDAWQLLRGVTCVYKPPDYAISSLQRAIKVLKVLRSLVRCELKLSKFLWGLKLTLDSKSCWGRELGLISNFFYHEWVKLGMILLSSSVLRCNPTILINLYVFKRVHIFECATIFQDPLPHQPLQWTVTYDLICTLALLHTDL